MPESCSRNNDGSQYGGQIPMSVQYDQPSNLQQPNQRMPAKPVWVNQENHLFTFQGANVGETIEIYDGETLLYVSVIDAKKSIEIPSEISGEVELRLCRGNLTYYALVEL